MKMLQMRIESNELTLVSQRVGCGAFPSYEGVMRSRVVGHSCCGDGVGECDSSGAGRRDCAG